MKKILIIAIAMLIAAPAAQSQWLKKLGEKAVERAKDRSKQKVEDKVNEKVDKTVDKVFETGEDIITGNDKEGENAEENAVEKKTTPAADPKAKTDEQPQVGKDAEMSWNKFDFVAGDEIMFEDLLVGEQLGEFPSKWDLIEGNVEIAKVDGENAISLYKTSQIKPLMKEPKNYLPESFTIELDFFMYKNYEEKLSLGIYQFYLMDEGKEILQFYFRGHPIDNQIETTADYISSSGENKRIEAEVPFTGGGWHRLSLSFNKRALKIYIDQTRVANAPNCAQPKWFNLMGDYTNSGGETIFYIRNVRIAKGAVPLYDRMMTDGKFITYGITFDVGKSTIKPESMGEINRIVKLMQDNPDLKFSVEGHTDSTGNEATNQTLSDARSKAVVDKLVEMGIAATRLTSSGKGQSNPIADNGTDEGRAKNRRVEFVKM
ncbi:OmpA family protein [Parabacteroides sp.]